MKVFCTKHVLTKGIEEIDVEDCGDGMVKTIESWPTYLHGEGKEWHTNIESAKQRAEMVRRKKIVSLKKSLAKFEAMTFEVLK